MTDGDQAEAIDPDVDVHVPTQRRELRRHPVDVLAVIALGGVGGALARYGISLAVPTAASEFPWATFWVNVVGCFLIGVLMVLITEIRTAHRLVRPFLGVGILGGFTTFSTYAIEARSLIDASRPTLGLIYLAATALAALAAVEAGILTTRRLGGAARRKARRR